MRKVKIRNLFTALTLIFVLVFQGTAAFAEENIKGDNAENSSVTASENDGSDGQMESSDEKGTYETEDTTSDNANDDAIADDDDKSSDNDTNNDPSDEKTADNESSEDISKDDTKSETDIIDDIDIDDEQKSEETTDLDTQNNSNELKLNENTANAANAVASPELTATVSSSYAEVEITLKNAPDTTNTYQFAIWSNENGQDDLKWVDATLNSKTAKASVSLSNFKHTGDFHVHCYRFDKNGTATYVDGTMFNLEAPSVKCSLSDLQDGGIFKFHMDSISVPSGSKSVKIAVWSKSDKSDVRWGKWNGNDITCRLYSFNNNFGTYHVEVYVTDNNGMVTLAGSCKKTYKNTMTFAYNVKMAAPDVTSSKFTVTIKGLNASNGIKALKAAVWSKDDQSNLCWYDKYEDQGNGTYVFYGDFSNHAYKRGTYKIHVYITDKNGNETFLIGNTKSISGSCKGINYTYSDTTTVVDLELAGFKSYGKYKEVRYAVWSRSDQGDLKWISCTSGGNFKLSYNMSNFGVNGLYNVHCYGFTDDGSSVYLAGVAFEVYGINMQATYKLIKVSDEKVKIRVYNANVGGKAPEKVRVGVWSAATGIGNGGEQDDLVWYTAKLNSTGTYYYTTIDRAKHLSSGLYHIHVYADRGNESAFCCGTTYNLYKVRSFDGIYKEVAVNSILACETGGQVYGNCTYGKFVEAYKNSSGETGISIGCACWMGSRAVQLLMDIRDADPVTFAKLDTVGISSDLDYLAKHTSLWNYYGGRADVGLVIKSGSAKAICISNLISSDAGIAVQNAKVAEEVGKYINAAASSGVNDIDAQILMAETAWLGGTGAMNRIISKASSLGYDMTLEDLWKVMKMDQLDTSNNNQVGDSLYETRHTKIIGWIYQYLN